MSEEIKVQVCKYPDRSNLVMRYVDPLTGKQKTKSAGTADEGEAVKAAGKWEAELREGRYQAPNKLTWAEFRKRYEAEKLASLAKRTRDKAGTVFAWVETVLDPRRVADLTDARISHLQAEMRKKKLAEPTIKSHLAHLAAALSWGHRLGMVTKLPRIDKPHRAKVGKMMKGRPITLEELERMIEKIPEVVLIDRKQEPTAEQAARDKAVVASWERLLWGLWWSGLRLAESCALWWDRDDRLGVDLSGEFPMLRIPAALEKGNRERLLPMAPEFAEWLLKTPQAERTGPVFDPLAQRIKNMRLLPHRVGEIVADIGRAAKVVVSTDPVSGKVKYASAHDCRRAFATRWAARADAD